MFCRANTIVLSLIIAVGSLTFAADKSEKILLKSSYKNEYSEYLLPSRIPTMSLTNLKSIPGATQFKPIKDYYQDLLTAQITIGNNMHTFLLERNDYKPGKKSKAKLMFNPVALKLKQFWEEELTRKPPEGVKDLPQKVRLKYFLSGVNPLAKDKAEKFAGRQFFHIKTGKPSKGKHYTDGYAYPMPTGLGNTQMNQLYNASVGKVSADFYIYNSMDWLEKMNKKGLKMKIAVIFPAGSNTYNWGYFRSGTVLKGDLDKVDIILFDDNLNNIYAEPGIDSIKVGDSCITTVGTKISINGKIYNMENSLERKKKGNYLNLTPTEEKTGKIKLKWNGDGAEIILAQVKSGSDYYPLFRKEENKKSYSNKKKKKGAKVLSVSLPEGSYTLAGGAVKKEIDKEEFNYAFFEGGNSIKVKAGETTEVNLGEPYTAALKFISKGKKRIINCGYPVGVGGEKYRWLLPRPERIRMTLKGEGEGFIKPISKNMQMIDNGKTFLTRTFTYDPVIMAPENGPFNITVEINPMVFGTKEISIKRDTMEAPKKKAKPKKKTKAKKNKKKK